MKTFLFKDRDGRSISKTKIDAEFFAEGHEDRENIEAFLDHSGVGDTLQLYDDQVIITRTADRDDSLVEFLQSSRCSKGIGFRKFRFADCEYEIIQKDGLFSVVIGNTSTTSENPFVVAAALVEHLIERGEA